MFILFLFLSENYCVVLLGGGMLYGNGGSRNRGDSREYFGTNWSRIGGFIEEFGGVLFI